MRAFSDMFSPLYGGFDNFLFTSHAKFPSFYSHFGLDTPTNRMPVAPCSRHREYSFQDREKGLTLVEARVVIKTVVV